MRRASKTDANQAAIVATARQCGMHVYDTSMVGGGFPDLVVQFNGVTELWEVKNPMRPKYAQKLNKLQEKARDAGLRARTVMTTADVLDAHDAMLWRT